jgi:hypothetical protein
MTPDGFDPLSLGQGQESACFHRSKPLHKKIDSSCYQLIFTQKRFFCHFRFSLTQNSTGFTAAIPMLNLLHFLISLSELSVLNSLDYQVVGVGLKVYPHQSLVVKMSTQGADVEVYLVLLWNLPIQHQRTT